MRRLGKSALGIAVTERAVAGEIGTQALVQHWRVGLERRNGIDNHRQRLVVDLDQIECVLGEITARRDDDHGRLPDIAHAVDGDRPAFDGSAHADDEAGRMGGDIRTRDHRSDARRRSRRSGTNAGNLRVRMRRAQNPCMERAVAHRHIVNVAPIAAQQRRVLDTLDRAADPSVKHICSHPHCLTATRKLLVA